MGQPSWATSSYGDGTETSPMELWALGEHLGVCSAGSGRWFAVRCGAQALHGFLAGRLVTTLVVVAGVIGALIAVF